MNSCADKQKSPLVIFHFPCPDGFGAAYAAWRHFGNTAEYVGADHGIATELNVQGRDVFVLDFSFPKPRLEAMRQAAKSLLILDHHKTAQEDLSDFPGTIFDMSKSGARLAWEYFHPGQCLPKLLAYVEDRDLWNWELPESKDFLAYLDTLPFDFTIWDELAHIDGEELQKLLISGRAMNAKYDHLATQMAEGAEPVRLSGVVGSKLNASSLFTSKLGELLYLSNGTFALLWRIEKGLLCVSLRAKKGSIDVAEIARQYGGGGHEAAAAFRLTLGTPACKTFLDKYILGPGE